MEFSDHQPMAELKLRFIGDRDYLVLEGEQRVGRIRYAAERNPGIWIWIVAVHLTGRLPTGSADFRFVAMAQFKAAWELLKAGRCPSSSPRPTGQ